MYLYTEFGELYSILRDNGYEKILNDELKVDMSAIENKYSAEAIVSKFNNLYSMISRWFFYEYKENTYI